MFFKPKIFISSTLNLSKVRNKLKAFFQSVGADALLYEHNLTPSYSKKVYLEDIAIADFVIFIFHNKYGTKTDTGRSGIHEEWEAIKEVKVPFHIYVLQSAKKNEEMNEFLTNVVKMDQYSYYRFSSIETLLQRIKETTFQIAFEIENNRINNKDLSDDILNQLVLKRDYKLAMDVIKPFNQCLDEFQISDFINYDCIGETLGFYSSYFVDISNRIFIDRKFNDQIAPLMKYALQYIRLLGMYSTVKDNGKQFIYKGKIMQFKRLDCFYHVDNWKEVEKKLNELLHLIIEEFKKFRDYIFETYKDFELEEI